MGRLWFEDGKNAPIARLELKRAAISMLTARRAMHGVLPPDLTHDVSLEVMLTLYVADPDGVSADALVEEATVPPSITRRLLMVLIGEDLVAASDKVVRLTAFGFSRMDDLLSRVILSQRELMGWDQN